MHVTFDPQEFEAGHLNRAWSKLVKWLKWVTTFSKVVISWKRLFTAV